MSTRVENQITWSAAQSITISSATRVLSDEYVFNAADRDVAVLQVHVDNQGTPASGDYVTVDIVWTAGDILGDTGNDYDTAEYAERLGIIDTFATNTPGEDPARRSWHIPAHAKGFKLGLTAPQAGTRNIVARARVANIRD